MSCSPFLDELIKGDLLVNLLPHFDLSPTHKSLIKEKNASYSQL